MSDIPVPALCAGGPLHGYLVTVGGDGFLAADKANNRAWLYQRDNDLFRVCTDLDDSTVYTAGAVTGERVLDWNRLDETGLPVIPVTDVEENYAGAPVADDWPAVETPPEVP